MDCNAVGWFEIYVDDMNRAKAFYENVFGGPLDKMPTPDLEMFAFPGKMSNYGANGALVKMPGFSAGNNSVIIYFAVEDCAVEEKKIIDAGGELQKTKFSIGSFGFCSLVLDSEGNMIGLHSMK